MHRGSKSIIKAALRHVPFVWPTWTYCRGVCVCCITYENCWLDLFIGTVRRLCELIKNWEELSCLSFHWEEMSWRGKIKCPVQESTCSWTSPSWSICCPLCWTTQIDLVGFTSVHCIPLGNRTCRGADFFPETKGLINKMPNALIKISNSSSWQNAWMVIIK